MKAWLLLWSALLLLAVDARGAECSLTTVAELQRELFQQEQIKQTNMIQTNMLRSFELEGVVCAMVRERGFLVLQDKTGTALLQLPGVLQDNTGAALLELPEVEPDVRVGDRVRVAGTNCLMERDRFGIRVRTPVVDDDGLHSATNTLSGTVFLNSGMQPLRLEWFNYLFDSKLQLEYEGPGVPRQKVPDSVLWRFADTGAAPGSYQPGLEYASYNDMWSTLPDFSNLEPVKRGVATNCSVSYSARNEFTALVFDGFIKIQKPGNYTFYLLSDDGSRLEVGPPRVTCSIVNAAPRAKPVVKTVGAKEPHSWVEVEGEVVFAAENQRSMELELVERSQPVPVTVVNGESLFSTKLLGRHIRAQAVCEFSTNAPERALVGLIVPGAEQVQILPEAKVQASANSELLTNCLQVRALKPEEAAMGVPARIRGVVIASDAALSMVLEDTSGGAFIHLNWTLRANPTNLDPDRVHTNASTGFFVHVPPSLEHRGNGILYNPLTVPPAVGQLWEIEGRTDPGDFSPVIYATNATYLGQVAMPEPIQPTWDQLINGSLDAEYVELRGVVLAISTNEMTLLMPNGKVTIEGGSGTLGAERPLPGFPGVAPEQLVGSLVRIRGCFTADWDFQTRHVIPARFFLFPAVTEIEEPAPPDVFSLPVTKASDLLSFNARARALQRIKVAGQIVHARDGECFVLDGPTGVRVRGSKLEELLTGDLVEAVGFLRAGGPSPVLQEAQVRKTGRAPLPDPVPVLETNLLASEHDSTLVRVEGTLINSTLTEAERVLELQNGAYHFAAVLNAHQAKWMPDYAMGSRLQVTGVYVSENAGDSGTTASPFEILLNDARGVVVLQRPPWWTVQRALWVAAVLAGTLAIAFIWIRMLQGKVEQRTKELEKEIETRQLAEQHRYMEQERIRVARDLHDELGAGLTEVGILGALARNPAVQPEERAEYLAQLTQSAGTLVTSLDEIVWAINPQYDSLSSLATYYSLFAQRFLNLAGIACRLRVSGSITEHPLNSKLRHGIFLAFKEALNNVVRHSGATEVEIAMEQVNNELAISIRDNGKGLNGSPAPGHDGLSGMRERLEQFGGNCRIESKAGQGTVVEFRLNLNGSAA